MSMKPRRSKLALGLAALALVLFGSSLAEAKEKYALALFHYNLQYVAGGMVGFSFLPNPELDLDADAIEDLIILESFAPVIELYEKHPSWGADIELQGYFLDVLAARHPALLDKLRKLAKAGQLDVVSFHYSDQLFIAHPEQDWLRSRALTAATFAKHDVPLSRTVFCQEGQAGEGMARRMLDAGYRNMVWPKNLWTYQHGEFDAMPLYGFGPSGDVFLIAGAKGVSYQQGSLDLEVTWTFFDDGELLATGDFNPYTPDVFKKNAEALAQYEAELVALEADGWSIVTVDQYVDAVKNRVALASPPPLLDGTWQPNSTTGVLRWLGGKGIWEGERDNEVRTLMALAHRELVAAETAAKQADLDARSELDSAWRLLFLSQVSDASGINPFRGEVEYGIAHATEALRIARGVIREAKTALGRSTIGIDPGADLVGDAFRDELRGEPADGGPVELAFESGDREVSARWELVEPGHHRLELDIGVGTATSTSVTFAGELSDEIVTTRALADEELATYLRSSFSFESFHLPLPLGLVSVAPDTFVIADRGRVHLAAEIRRDNADVTFLDQTLTAGETARWVFHVYQGSGQQALELARRINSHRRLVR